MRIKVLDPIRSRTLQERPATQVEPKVGPSSFGRSKTPAGCRDDRVEGDLLLPGLT